MLRVSREDLRPARAYIREMHAKIIPALVCVAFVAMNTSAAGDRAIESVFFVAKTENRNQVHYGVRVDDACVPLGEAPVFAEWRMFEEGPNARAPMLSREQRLYGLGTQTVIRRADGGAVVTTLRAVSSRPITVETSRDRRGVCVAKAVTRIDGAAATLSSVFVVLRGFGVDAIVLSGRRDGGTVASERIER